ncbi:MAG: DUF2334 domain-containing protein [Sarcina sp.]
MKKALKITGISLAVILVLGLIYFNSLTYKKVRVEEGELTFQGKEKENKEKATISLDSNYESKSYNVEGLKFFLEGKEIKLESKVYERNQRYYLNLEEFLKEANLDYEKENEVYKVNNNKLDLKNKNFTINNEVFQFRGETLENESSYISLNDLEHFLGLRDKWIHSEKKIYLFKEKKEIKKENREEKKSGKAAMMRIEDFAAGWEYLQEDYIDKYKIMADYLYSKDFKFNIAWISRYKNPAANIDNNLLENRNIENIHFMNLMDHLIFRGATIGLHGYTHQSGNEESAVGSDLSSKANNTVEETEEIIKAALKTAEILNIPIDFFESAHYHATMKQQRVIEKYFDIAYEPFKYYWSFNPLRSPMDKSTLYLPTTLSYVKDETGEEMASKIRKKAKGNTISSFYFHPLSKELKFIELKEMDEEGYVDYQYNENSVLHVIIKALEETNQVTVSAKDFR